MARLEDYLPKTDDKLGDEISDAVIKTEERQAAPPTIPSRFEGKSAEEIADSYVNLERKFSQQGNDLGDMRKQVDALMRQSVENSTANANTQEETAPVTVDELYEDPEKAIEKVIQRKLQPQLEAQEQRLQTHASERQQAKLDTEYDGWREEVKTPEFSEWLEGSSYRQRMAAAVREYGDFDAAGDLLAQYYDTQKATATEKPKPDVASATLETAGAQYSEPVEKFSRTELMTVRIRAKQGDRAASMWLDGHRDAIGKAYAEGRIVD